MLRALLACTALAALTPTSAVAQAQFMPFATRERTPLLGLSGITDNAVGGDLDGDGRCDLVVCTGTALNVFKQTTPGWTLSWLTWVGQTHPVLTDLDSDGDLDIVCVPRHLSAQEFVSVFRNTLGTIAPVAIPWTGPAHAAAVGDVDGDGRVDLVVAAPATSGAPSLVLVRAGPGAYTLDTASMPSGLPHGLWPELLDADSDGDLDVLAAQAGSGLRLLRNVGGSFVDATATLPPARTGHDFLVRGDFDGDGRDDCAATLPTGDVDVLWGGASGSTFAPGVATVPGLRRLWPADFDRDGDLDLLAQHTTGLRVLWNTGNRQFAGVSLLAWQSHMRGLADVDGDGAQDVVFADVVNGPVRCKYRARFEDAAYAVGLEAMSGTNVAPLLGDVHGDGRTDVVHVGGAFSSVDRALGGGAYERSSSPLSMSASNMAWASELADLDGDRALDIVVKSSARLTIASNNGAGTFAPSLQNNLLFTTSVDGLRLGDVDGDGDTDIVHDDAAGAVLVRNVGQGQYAPAVVVVPVPPTHALRCLELADVDGDGDLDLVTDVVAASGITHVIAANDGTGTFAPSASFYVNLGMAPISVRAADLDGDGDVDLVSADGTPRVYRNNGSGVFADRTPFDLPVPVGSIVSNLAIADLDDDGDRDIAALTTANPPLLLLFNDGSGRFVDRSAARAQPGFSAAAASGWCLRAGDLDGDGDVDLVAGGMNTSAVLVNHLRHCASRTAPRLGGVAEMLLYSGPGFGSPGLAVLGVGFALASPPLPVPGLAGRLELDPTTLQIVAAVTTSTVGVSSVFVAVPQDPVLIALEVWFQGAILPATGQPGFTNAVYEVILR